MRLADSFFGSIALKNRMLTREQLAEALRVQWERAQGGIGPELGSVCVQLGYLSASDVTQVVQAQLESELLLEETLLGQIAVRNGLLREEDLKGALEEQKSRGPGARLGHLLIERSVLNAQQVHAILTSQRRMKKSGRIVEALKPTITPAKASRRRRRRRVSTADIQLPAEGRCWDNDAVRIARLTSGGELEGPPPARKRVNRRKKPAAAPGAASTAGKTAQTATRKATKKAAEKVAKKVTKKVAKKTKTKTKTKTTTTTTKKAAKKVAKKPAAKTTKKTTKKKAARKTTKKAVKKRR